MCATMGETSPELSRVNSSIFEHSGSGKQIDPESGWLPFPVGVLGVLSGARRAKLLVSYDPEH